jgi:LPPG:FO 2-phospho-L-lactate transferase
MAELGITISALSVAEHYRSFIDGFVLDILDEPLAEAVVALGITVEVTDTVMQTLDDRQRLARRTMALLGRLFETDRRVVSAVQE